MAIELAVLDAEVAATKGQAVKESTKRNLLTYLNSYQKFCDRYNLSYFPIDNNQLCRYGQYLARTFKSADAVGNYQSGVRTCQALLGFEIPSTQEKQMQLFMQGIKRILVHEVRQAEPITPQTLLKLSAVVDYTDHIEMVAWVATLLGFTMFLRKSNLVPDTMDTFQQDHQFTRADVNMTGPLSAMMFNLRWTKTIQFKQKVLRLPVLPIDNKRICPVIWMHYMINTIPAEPQDPAFTIWYKGKKTALSANQLLNRLRKWLKLVKEPQDLYTLHSLRRGGATFAFQSNMEHNMIKLLGDWASDAYKRYCDVSMEKRFDSMETFVAALNKVTTDIKAWAVQ